MKQKITHCYKQTAIDYKIIAEGIYKTLQGEQECKKSD